MRTKPVHLILFFILLINPLIGWTAVISPIPDKAIAEPGNIVCVQVNVVEFSDLYAAGFDFIYNPSALDFLYASEGTLLNKDNNSTFMQAVPLNGNKASGKLIVGISRLGNVPGISGSGMLLALCFKVIGGQCSYSDINFENTALEGARQGNSLDAVWNSAKINVYDPAKPDVDRDRVNDQCDNCTNQSNTNQRDTDGDGYGNICDPDITNNCYVNTADLAALKAAFGSCFGTPRYNQHADFNGDNCVNTADLAILKKYFGKQPGPGLGSCK